MSDEFGDLKRAEARRWFVDRADAERHSFRVEASTFSHQVYQRQSSTSERRAGVSRNADGKEVISYAVWARVKNGVRQARWNAAIGRVDPQLEKALAKFLNPTSAPTGSDYVAAAEALGLDKDDFRGMPAKRSGLPQFQRPGGLPSSGQAGPGGASSAATDKLPSPALQKLLNRRQALASAIESGRTPEGRLLKQSDISSLLQQFTLVNTLIASSSVLEGVNTVPSASVDTVASGTPAGQEIRQKILSVAQLIGQARALANRRNSGALSTVERKTYEATRQRLRHLYERGVVIRGHIVALSALHPELAQFAWSACAGPHDVPAARQHATT